MHAVMVPVAESCAARSLCDAAAMTPTAAAETPDDVVEPPVVTIIVPLYNGGPFIDETLQSVLAQTFGRFEVIVVDDGSTDDGLDIVRARMSDPRVKLVGGGRRGVAEARNVGAAGVSGASRYLTFLDADDVWHPDALATLMETLERRPDAAGAFVLAEYIDGDGKVFQPGDFPRHMRGREDLRDGRFEPRDPAADVHFEHLFVANLVYPPGCLLIRRSAYDRTGGFDGTFLAEDGEFVIRLARQGPLVPVDRVLAGYRRHSSNATGNRARNIRGARQLWAAVYHDDRNDAGQTQRLRGIWRAHQARTARRKLAEGNALIARGKVLHGVLRSADAAAHVLLRHPPRIWIALGSKAREREFRDTVLPRPGR